MKKLLKDTRGLSTVELLWVLPVLFMMFLFIIESSFIMYDFAVVNYFTSTAAEKAAMEGGFNDTIRQSLQTNLRNWTSNGKTYSFDTSGTSGYYSPGVVVVYGTDGNTQVHRGDDIEVGVVYPVRFKTFIIRGAFQWIVEQKELTLKAQAVSTSEKYFE